MVPERPRESPERRRHCNGTSLVTKERPPYRVLGRRSGNWTGGTRTSEESEVFRRTTTWTHGRWTTRTRGEGEKTDEEGREVRRVYGEGGPLEGTERQGSEGTTESAELTTG